MLTRLPCRAAALLAAVLAAASAEAQLPFHVERAPEWEARFQRYSGWTGADGCFSIALSGQWRPGTGGLGRTIFTFGDTFIGSIDPHTGRRLPGASMVNNTFAIARANFAAGPKSNFFRATSEKAIAGTPKIEASIAAATVPE